MSTNTKVVETWLCHIGQHAFALPASRVKMIIEDPDKINILGAAQNYQNLLLLQDKFYPILNSSAIFSSAQDLKVAVLVPYRDKPSNQVEYGVLELDDVPIKIHVNDEMAINKSELTQEVAEFALMGFNYDHKAVGVLDIDTLFNL